MCSIQLRILKRAMDMLKPGGRLVYSTCSFNPVENEAVIAAALKARKGELTHPVRHLACSGLSLTVTRVLHRGRLILPA